MNGAEFEWDDRKAASNERKHAVTFEMARDVFKDPFGIDELDEREDYGEDRFLMTGVVEGHVLIVAYAMHRRRYPYHIRKRRRTL